MKAISRIFAQILVLILIITTSISLFLLAGLNSTEHLFSKQNIINTVKNLDMKQLMGDQIQTEIYDLLEQTGLPKDYVDYILENEEVKEYLGKYVAEGMDYILYEKEPPVLSAEELTITISNSFDYAINQLESHNIDVSEYLTKEDQITIHQKIETITPKIVEKIPEAETFVENIISQNENAQMAKQKLEEFRTIMKIIQKVYQYKFLLIIGIIVQLALIVLLKINQFHFIKWLMIPFITISLALSALYHYIPILVQQYYPQELEPIRIYIDEMLNSIYKIWQNHSIFYFIVFVLLIIFQIVICLIRQYHHRQKDMATL